MAAGNNMGGMNTPDYGEEYKAKALELYVSMPEEATLLDLHKALIEKVGYAPVHRTLGNWSAKEDWQGKRVLARNERLNSAVESLALKGREEEFHAKKDMRYTAGTLLKKARKELESADYQTEATRVRSACLVLDKVVALVKEARVEDGGVSDRIAEEITATVEDKRKDAESAIFDIMAAVAENQRQNKPKSH